MLSQKSTYDDANPRTSGPRSHETRSAHTTPDPRPTAAASGRFTAELRSETLARLTSAACKSPRGHALHLDAPLLCFVGNLHRRIARGDQQRRRKPTGRTARLRKQYAFLRASGSGR